jgi:hypothetical protein
MPHSRFFLLVVVVLLGAAVLLTLLMPRINAVLRQAARTEAA